MTTLINQCGNFLFHTRNGFFPVFVGLILFIYPPVAIDNILGLYLMAIGFLTVITGQGLRILTIGLSYIVRGGQKRRIYAEKLVTDGIFAHCRNPLYLGNILIVTGFFCISGNLTGIMVGALSFITIYMLIVRSEEAFLRDRFAEDYTAFCADTPRWALRFKGLKKTISRYGFDWTAVAVKEYGALMTSLMLPLGLIAWKLHIAHKLNEYRPILIGLALLIMTAYGFIRFLKKTERIRAVSK